MFCSLSEIPTKPDENFSSFICTLFSLMAALSENVLTVSMLLSVVFLPGDAAGCTNPVLIANTPGQIEALSGSCLQVSCSFNSTHTDFGKTNIYYGIWLKNITNLNDNPSCLIFNSSGSVNKYSLKMIGNVSEKNCTTLFTDLNTSYNDTYYLRIENGAFKATDVCPLNIKVKDSPWSPSINVPSDLKEHQSVTVTCSAFTPCPQSPPKLTWNLQQDSLNQTVKNTDGTFTTKIQENITLSDTHDGYNIRCSARYPVTGGNKTAETNVTLSVSYAPRNTSASISPSGLVSAGSWVELNCSSRAKPPPSFTWFRNNKQGAMNVSVGQVYSFNVTEGGEYYCVATNDLGNETSSRLCVGIKDSPWSPSINVPSDLKEHQSVTVTCSAFTPCPQSPPKLTWNLQQDSLNQTEKNTDGTFTTKIQKNITLSDTHDGYNISCSARYPVVLGNKTDETKVTLSVSYAPRNTSASIRPSGLVSAGSRVELSCSSRAKPPPSFTWFRNSEQGAINVSMEQIYSFNVPEGGEYHCMATNHLGKEGSSVILVTMTGEKLLVPVTVGIIVVICFLVFLVVSVWYFMSKHSPPQKLQSQMDIDLGVQNPAFEQEEELHYGEIKVIKKAPIVSLIPVQDNDQQETIYAQVKVSTPENPSTQPDDSPENNYAEVKKK
ncbi:myelin-associated glycoprotein-like [Xiphophorus maculatus]|uniref:myelin-associated glycoprotein-like n=1 Tax=Xiphophorus maculatus TaxID=8083 RepID=UPI000C6EAC24|nr:myelin-associated glycoprotein-like [Xiphophorus maculatus]